MQRDTSWILLNAAKLICDYRLRGEDQLNVLLITLLFAFLVGGGWTFVVFGKSKSIVFHSATTFLFAAATASLSWCWVYGLGGAIREVNVMIVVLAVVGWLAALWKLKSGTLKTDDERVKYRLADFGIVLAIIGATFFVGLFPKMDTPTTLTMAFRTGPDAMGLTASTEGLLRDGTFLDLKNKISAASINNLSIEDITNGRTKAVNEIPSVASSIKAEWLVGPSRWGFAGIAANILSVIGIIHLWEVLAILPSLSVMFGSFFIYETLKESNYKTWLSGLCVVGGICNVNLLHAWQEGGLSQSFVFIGSSIIIFGLLNSTLSRAQMFILGATATIFVLPNYPDLFILLVLLCLSLLFVALRLRMFDHALQNGLTMCISLLAGLALSGPYIVRFAIGISRRIAESGVGGWQQPVWTGFSENLGLFNPYNNFSNSGHPGFSEFIVIVLDATVIGFLIKRIRFRLPSIPAQVSICVSAVIIFFYFKTRYIDQSSNYIYFKVVGMFSPFLLTLLFKNSRSGTANKRDRRILAIFCILSIAASSNYVLNYRNTSTRMSSSVPENLLQVRAELDNYDVIIPRFSMEWISIISFVDLRIINRKDPFLIDPKESHLLAITIDKRSCPQWKCLSNVPEQNFQILTSKFAILLFEIDSSALIQPGVTDYEFISQVVTRASLQVKGPIFDRSLQPISD